ncbi:MAG TPA: AraC family transcriptional regulator [Sphingomonas sp.]|nr:AraC family transcriptional regulator [Sphingomonas sp.]
MADALSDDPLSVLAPLLRVRPVLDDLCRFGGDWASPHDAEGPGWAHFHIITKGSCLIDRVGHGAVLLEAGDVLLLPHGDPHVVRALAPGTARGRPIMRTEYRNAIRVKQSLDVEQDVELICGRLQFEAAPESLLVSVLPDVVVLRAANGLGHGRLQTILEGIHEELDSDAPGAAAIATDLASALFVMLLRAHLDAVSTSPGVLRLLGQRGTMRALLAMVRDPAHDWTLEELALQAVMSRATLVRAFRAAAGVAPLAFLTDLRLSLARQRLQRGHASIGEIAADVGYQSEAAFSRAMLRRYGVRPGALRPDRGTRSA